MKRAFCGLMMFAVFFMFMGATAQMGFAQEESGMSKTLENKNILVVYFSHTGNTRELANQIHDRVGGDIFEIKTVVPYVNDYDTLTKQARKELDSDFRPELQDQVQNMDSYDVIFIGYPIWWGTYPMAVKTFLSEHDLSGKIVIPFCTHEGSRLGQSISDLKEKCPNSTLLDGLEVRGSSVKTDQDKVVAWLEEINIIK